MRFLPDKPSLGFLRKEAKDVLAALRESRPEASLADAQKALASQYGLRDWTQLRSEAEQRARELPVAPDGLADDLAAAFGLGSVAGAASPMSYTPMGRCWSVTTDRGRWLAGTVYPFITDAQAEVGSRLREAAVAAGVSAPSPVRSPQGRLIETVQGEKWRIHEWTEAGPTPVTPTSAAVAHRIGTIYGRLHALAIPSETPIGWFGTRRHSDAEWEKLLDRARAAHRPFAAPLRDALPAIRELHTIELDINPNDLILCNRNIIPEHVRLARGGELLVTEWDFAGSQTPDLELGGALITWMSRPSISGPAIAAFRDGYVDAAGQWPRLTLASFAAAVTGWLNWTYNSICEAINPTDDDHGVFVEQEANDMLNCPLTLSSVQQLLEVAGAQR